MSALSAISPAASHGPSLLASSQQLANQLSPAAHSATPGINATAGDQSQLRENFNAFVGQTFYGMMLQQMHKTVGKPAYMYGGRGEEAFQGQLDQVLSEKMSKADGGQFG